VVAARAIAGVAANGPRSREVCYLYLP